MSFAISSPGTLGGYNNTSLGFDMIPTSGRDTHVYFTSPQNIRAVVNKEQYLNKVMSKPIPIEQAPELTTGMKPPPIPKEMLDGKESVTKRIAKASHSDEEEDRNTITDGPNLSQLLREHDLLVKYTRGDDVVKRVKKTLKKGAYNRFVKFKVGKKLPYSPQYFLDGELTDFTGYLNNELLRINMLQQLAEWANVESEEDSSEDSSSDSEESSESDEEEKVEEVENDEEVEEVDDEEVEEIDDEEVEEIDDEEVEEIDDEEKVSAEKETEENNIDNLLESEDSD